MILLLMIAINVLFLGLAVVPVGWSLQDQLVRANQGTPFLARAFVYGGKNQYSYIPVGLWHVHCLEATYHATSSGNEEEVWW